MQTEGFFNIVLGLFRACSHMVVQDTSYMLCMGSCKVEKIRESPQVFKVSREESVDLSTEEGYFKRKV